MVAETGGDFNALRPRVTEYAYGVFAEVGCEWNVPGAPRMVQSYRNAPD